MELFLLIVMVSIGCVQKMFVPSMSGILVFRGQSRLVCTGGNRSNLSNYEVRGVPDMKMVIPYQMAMDFSNQIQQALRDIKDGTFEKSLEFSHGPIVNEPRCMPPVCPLDITNQGATS